MEAIAHENYRMKKNAMWMLSGNGIYAASQAANLLIINHTLGTEAAGYFAFGMALSAPIALLFNLGLRTQLATDVDGEVGLHSYEITRRWSSGLAVVATSLISIMIMRSLVAVEIAFLLSISKAIEGQAELKYGDYQRQGNHSKIAQSLILRGLSGLLGLASAIALFGNIAYGCVGYVVGWLLVVIFHDNRHSAHCKIKKRVHQRWLLPYKKIITLGVPLGLAALLINLNVAIPRIYLSKVTTIEQLGIYSTLYLVAQIGSITVASLGQTMISGMSRALNQKKANLFARHVSLGVAISLLIGAVGLFAVKLLGSRITPLLFGRSLPDLNEYLLIMFLFVPVQYAQSFLGYCVAATRKNAFLLGIHIATVFTTAVCSLVLIPAHGIKGAICSVGIGACVGVVLYVTLLYVTTLALNKTKNNEAPSYS